MSFAQSKFETERLLLRPFLESDWPDLLAMESDPEVHRYLGNQPVTDSDEIKKIISWLQWQYQEYELGRWAAFKKEDNSFIGWGGLKYETDVRSSSYFDLGYRLMPFAWQQGFGTEIAQFSIAYGFKHRGFDLICGAAHVNNTGSNKILNGVGMDLIETFTFEGEEHNWYEIHKSKWGPTN